MTRAWTQHVQQACGEAGFLLVHPVYDHCPWSSDAPTAVVEVVGGGRCLIVCDHALPQVLLATLSGVAKVRDATGDVGEALAAFVEAVAACCQHVASGDEVPWSVSPAHCGTLAQHGGAAALASAQERVVFETDDGLRLEVAWWN